MPPKPTVQKNNQNNQSKKPDDTEKIEDQTQDDLKILEEQKSPEKKKPNSKNPPVKKSTRWLFLVLGAVAIAIIVTGIGYMIWAPKTEQAADTETNTNQPVIENPDLPDLMGGDRFDRGHYYPVAIMIDNLAPARPQSGLQAASVVYEALVEGGITRFMAVFDHGDISQIGPVRSARPYFLSWLAEYDAAYAHAGGSPEALGNINKNRVHDINALSKASRAFYRDKTRPAPHNLYTTSNSMYTTTQAMKLKISDVDLVSWQFATSLDALPTAAVDIKKVTLNFSGSSKSSEVSYTYDAVNQNFLRNSAGKSHEDRLTKAQIKVKNLIIQTISNKIIAGEKGRLTMTVTGTGKAKIFQNGKVFDATWTKTDENSRTIFTLADGSQVKFQVGNTWIEVLPEGRTVVIE
ncbi:MAG: DUF3048 domain-containing protein [Patescibacteria group bacterium]|jgi:hypothetical protein